MKTITEACSTPVREEGEIHLLADEGVENLDEFEGVESGTSTVSYGDIDDDRAIRRIKMKLGRASTERTDEQIEDAAIQFYNSACDGIRTGRFSDEQIRKAADIFGESPEMLVGRLQETAV